MSTIKVKIDNNIIITINKQDIPLSVIESSLEFEIDEKMIWEIEEKTTSLPMSEFYWMLNIKFWPYNNKLFSVSYIDVLNNKIKYKYHYNKIKNADMNYPIDIIFYKNKWLILDGAHRFSKAFMHDHDYISVRKHSFKSILECMDRELTDISIQMKYL